MFGKKNLKIYPEEKKLEFFEGPRVFSPKIGRFLKILKFFFTRGPPGGILKIFASYLLGVYGQCRTCTMKAIKGSWLLESHTQKIRKIAHTGAKLQSFL